MDQDYVRRMAQVEDHHWWFVARRRIVYDILQRIGLQQNARLLEAGCGTGGNLEMLGAFGPVDAFEPLPEALQHARGRVTAETGTRARLEPGDLPDAIPFAGVSYDAVLLLDVLEHVQDDAGALAALRDRLKTSGRLIVTVPAYRWLWSSHDELNNHHRRYTTKTLDSLLRSTGFETTTITYFNMWLLPAVVAVRMLKKLTRRNEDDLWMPRPGMNAILGRVMASEKFLVHRSAIPFGVSILAVAKVPAFPAKGLMNRTDPTTR